MAVVTRSLSRAQIFNIPNKLSALRLVLAVVVFVFVPLGYAWSYWASLILFAIAASTDWVDGYLARKYGQVTPLGRMLDPFVDKIIICGTFIFLAAVPISGIRPWMAVVVVGRELLVTAMRSLLEGEGADFSATMSGKLKMVWQCLAVGVSLYALTMEFADRPEWLQWTLLGTVWLAIGLTIYSGGEYVLRAIRIIRQVDA